MPTEIPLREAKARLSALIDRVEAGEEIVVTRRGVPAARLSPARPPRRRLGALAGRLRVAEDFDETPDAVIRAFEGTPLERDAVDRSGDGG